MSKVTIPDLIRLQQKDIDLIRSGYTHVEYLFVGAGEARECHEMPCHERDIPRGHVNYYRRLGEIADPRRERY